MVKVVKQFRECKIKSLLTSSPGSPFFPLSPFGPRSPLAPYLKNGIKKRLFCIFLYSSLFFSQYFILLYYSFRRRVLPDSLKDLSKMGIKRISWEEYLSRG